MRLSKISLFFLILGLFGLLSCVDDYAEVTVTYTKGTPIYGNMSEIRQTPLAGSSREIVNPGKIFVGDNYLLIGEEGVGIHVVDNTNPSTPTNVAFINIPGNREFFLKDGILYAESYYDVVKVDVTNPKNPILLGRAQNGISDELTNEFGQALLGFDLEEVTEKVNKNDDIYNALGESNYILFDYNNNLIPPSAVPASFAGNSASTIGSVNRMVAYEGYLYVVSRSNLLVFIEGPDFKKVYGEAIGWGGNMETVFPMGDHLFIGATTQMMIMDVSNPESPQYVSNFWHATSCDPVVPTENGVAYVTLRTGDFAQCPGDQNALIVLDIVQLEAPSTVQEITMASPFGLALLNNKLYVGEGENGFKIFDATDPRNLKLIKWESTIKAYDVLSHPTRPDYILIAGTNGLSQYKIGNGYEHVSTLAY